MLEENIKEYFENGYTKYISLVDPEVLNEIEKEINGYLLVQSEKLVREQINKVDGKINSVHGLPVSELPKLRAFLEDSNLNRILSACLNDEPEFRKTELFLKPAKVGLASPTHQDDFYWCVNDHNALTVWIALDEASEENGGLTYYKGSHKLGILDHQDSFAPGSSQTVSNKEMLSNCERVCLPLKRGDALIHHALTVHESAANTSEKSRRGWTLQYKAKNSDYNQLRLDHYLNRLKLQVDSREGNKVN